MGYNKPQYISQPLSFAATNPIDATPYYFNQHSARSMNTTANYDKMYWPISGNIRACSVYTYAGTATGTAEDISIYIRVNDTTDYLVATVGAAAPVRVFQNFVMNVPIAAGDYTEMKWVSPTWVTNPEGVRFHGFVVIETA